MRLAPLLAALLLVGCALQPTPESKRPSLVTLPKTAELVRMASEARSFDHPAVATARVSAGFRYGCFCGANYPDLRHPSGKANPALNQDERRELAVQYFNIRPIDDIDAACQAHDVCWVLNGDGALECNEELEKSLEAFQDVVEKGHRFDAESLQFRCGWLALDIQFASLSVMQGTSNDAIKESALRVARILTSPIIVGYAFITEIKSGLKPYPEENERCSVRELAPRIQNAGA